MPMYLEIIVYIDIVPLKRAEVPLMYTPEVHPPKNHPNADFVPFTM